MTPPGRRAWLGRWLLRLGRLGLGAIFLLAAYGKLRPVGTAPFSAASFRITSSSLAVSQAMFAIQVDSYQLLSERSVEFVAHTLPWFELALGVLLVAGLWLRWAGLVASVLLAGFVAAIVHSYAAGLGINCGCFGPGAEPVNGWTIARDSLFLALGLAVTIGAFLRARARRASAAGSLEAMRESAPAP